MPLDQCHICIRLQFFCPCAIYMCVSVATRTYKCDDLYPICSKLQQRVPVGPYYACSYTVGLSTGIIPRFAVLNTEKIATLLSWKWDHSGHFFLLVCQSLEKKLQTKTN